MSDKRSAKCTYCVAPTISTVWGYFVWLLHSVSSPVKSILVVLHWICNKLCWPNYPPRHLASNHLRKKGKGNFIKESQMIEHPPTIYKKMLNTVNKIYPARLSDKKKRWVQSLKPLRAITWHDTKLCSKSANAWCSWSQFWMFSFLLPFRRCQQCFIREKRHIWLHSKWVVWVDA